MIIDIFILILCLFCVDIFKNTNANAYSKIKKKKIIIPYTTLCRYIVMYTERFV